MRVQSVNFIKTGVFQKIELVPDDVREGENYFTVINGVNGTGKSAILRAITDSALEFATSKQKNPQFIDATILITGNISRTIAISNTHSDRFPSNSGIEFRRTSTQFDMLPFYYFGVKHDGRITSKQRASNTICYALFADSLYPEFPRNALGHLLNHLGYNPELTIEPGIGLRFRPGQAGSYQNHFEGLEIRFLQLLEKSSAPHKFSREFEQSIRRAGILVNEPNYHRYFREYTSGTTIKFDLIKGRTSVDFGINTLLSRLGSTPSARSLQQAADFIALGVLRTQLSLVRHATGIAVELEEVSSGEWNLLYSLLNLAITVEDNSLILIDEPENSLHPQWQSDYVSLVREMISHRTGCHIIIATHSPLISASILPEDGCLVRLERDEDNNVLRGELENNAYGWLPEDVLKERFDMDSVRPPELTNAINRALGLLKISSDPTPELIDAATDIKKYMSNLPSHDALLPVLTAIVEIAAVAGNAHRQADDKNG